MPRRQRWIKKGLIFAPTQTSDWLQTHTALPVADPVGQLYRIYFSSRNSLGKAQIGYFEIDLNNIGTVLRISENPVIGLGPMGAFDDSGVTTSWIVNYGQK